MNKDGEAQHCCYRNSLVYFIGFSVLPLQVWKNVQLSKLLKISSFFLFA